MYFIRWISGTRRDRPPERTHKEEASAARARRRSCPSRRSLGEVRFEPPDRRPQRAEVLLQVALEVAVPALAVRARVAERSIEEFAGREKVEDLPRDGSYHSVVVRGVRLGVRRARRLADRRVRDLVVLARRRRERPVFSLQHAVDDALEEVEEEEGPVRARRDGPVARVLARDGLLVFHERVQVHRPAGRARADARLGAELPRHDQVLRVSSERRRDEAREDRDHRHQSFEPFAHGRHVDRAVRFWAGGAREVYRAQFEDVGAATRDRRQRRRERRERRCSHQADRQQELENRGGDVGTHGGGSSVVNAQSQLRGPVGRF
mmetsp:Transcript_33445/g.103611  ORF Transcript_33445/g.103611 Transcript_33445/m.103611 type:complete len:321 (+) Transcript_33445:28-990(+)